MSSMDPPMWSLMKHCCSCVGVLASQDWSKGDEKLLQAVEQDEPEKVAALILKKGLCPSKLDTEGKSAFHLCASRGRMDCLEVILAHGVDINLMDGMGFNALHLAAKNGQPECLKRLLQERIPVDSTDSFGRTSLHHAAVSGCLSCTETLWDFKANLDVQDGDGATPLILGAQMSRNELCNFLLDRGANPNIQDSQGRSALMLASESDSLETVEVLLKGGADPQLADALGHDATHYSVTAGNRRITQLLQPGGGDAAAEGASEEQPPAPPPLPGGSTPRKRKAPPPPKSPRQGTAPSPGPPPPGPTQSPAPETSAPPSPAPRTQNSSSDNLAEDEEVFEEIRRLRLERGRLLQKIKTLEQQQSSATAALEELSSLRERLSEAEAERDHLQAALEELRGSRMSGVGCDSEDTDDAEEMLEFPGAERLLSKRSRGMEAETLSAQADMDSSAPSDTVEQLRTQVEELTAQNADLLLKVQMLEMFEKDDTDIQTSGPDSVPVAQYDSLRREFEELQEKYARAQAATEGSSIASIAEDDAGSEEKPGEGEDKAEKVKSLEEQLGHAQTELEELREQVRLGVYSVEAAGLATGGHSEAREAEADSDTQQLTKRVQELEAELASRKAEPKEGDNDMTHQLKQRVEELEASLQEKEKTKGKEQSEVVQRLKARVAELETTLEQSLGVGSEEAEGVLVNGLRSRVAELEAELRESVPQEQLDEVRVTLGLQLEQLAQERAEASSRLNHALLELERLRPPLHNEEDEEDEEDEEEDRSEGSEQSMASERSLRMLPGRRTLAAVQEELEVARQEAAQALDCLVAEREGRAQDALQLRDAIPLAKHQETLSAVAQQLGQTEKELQAERALREQAQAEVTRLDSELAGRQDAISKEEHEKIKAELQRSIEESRAAAVAAQDALSEKETELKELRSQKALEQGLVSKEDHESQRLSLQAEINTLTASMADLTRKHEKTCTEVFQVQREALFNKSERQVAEAQLLTVQQQLADLQAQSTHIQELHQDIQHSQGLIKEKDRKITELSKEVFRLKEALGALTPPLGLPPSSLSPPSNPSSGIPGQQLALQNRISALTQQLQDWERKHKAVVAIYRSHLLAAVQGRMDEEVQTLLLQILRMSQKGQSH
ncbi:ankyrin repeat domain-containing protein 24 isoform X1 [Astyanax mexicanus]|uniref:ankyrin repeat domain-containing protein 24 isoform X1 n=2 Tax=Astyanax mexicanus TaxID=7994 RepID=UPI0020CAC2FD|nr:ankyrin repeat domain-containing protein 24 isoform X1 [Astyanax mexicanus]